VPGVDLRPTVAQLHRPEAREPAAVLLTRPSGYAYGGLRRRRGEGSMGEVGLAAVAGVPPEPPNPRRRGGSHWVLVMSDCCI
jgi:hypothetical protein